MLHLKLLKPCLITNTIRLLKPWTSPSKNNFTNHFNHRCYPSTHMSALANGTRYSPSRIHTHPGRPTCATPLHFLSPRNWFVSRRGWFCLQRSREAKVDYRIYGQRGWKKSGPFDAKWILEEASGKRAPLPFFQLLSLAPSATSSHTPSLPFDFDAFPLCYRLSLCACRPWRGKRLHPLPLELVSFNNHHHHHHQRRYEGKRLGDFPQSLCASDAFSSGDLSAKISDPLSLPLSFSLRGSVIQGFN